MGKDHPKTFLLKALCCEEEHLYLLFAGKNSMMQKYDAVTITEIMLPNVTVAHVVESLSQLLAIDFAIFIEIKVLK